jgi:hypothetical protein
VKLAQAASGLAAMPLLAGCAASLAHDAAGRADPARGTVTGRMVREGGPIGPGGQQPGIHPITGTVRFTGRQHQVVTVRTSKAGRFSVRLAPGRYQVSDHSPRLLLVGANGISHQTWSRPVVVTVTAHHITRVTLATLVP